MNEIQRILNNTYSEKFVGEAINDVKLSNYNFLHEVQKNLVGHQYFDYTASDIKKDDRIRFKELKNKYIIKIPFEFIPNSKINSFIRSKFNRKPVDIFEINNNPIFYYTCLCFINGDFFTGYKIFPVNDDTFIIIDREYYLENLQYTDSKISFLIIPNLNIVSNRTNTYLLEKGISNSDINHKNKKFSYIHTITNDKKENIILLTKTQNGITKYTTPIPSHYYGTWLTLNRLGFQHLNGTKVIRGRDEYFDLPERNMPIVSDNMIVFERTSTGLTYAHGVRVEQFYPNIYKLKNHNKSKNYYVLHFYYDDTHEMDSEKMIYENKFSLLDRIGFNLLDGYLYDFLEPVVSDYKPENITYSISDFKKSEFDKPIDYKDEKLKELIKVDSKNSTGYFERQIEYPKKLYLDISRIDLEKRLRDNTSKETPHQVIRFRKPHYVFSLKKSILNDPYNMRIYIDGAIEVYHSMTENDFNVYLYIPCEFVTPFSMMEFESFSNVSFKHQFTLTNNEIEMDVHNRCKFCSDDILITDLKGKTIDPSLYNVFIKTDIGYLQLSEAYNTDIKNTIKITFDESIEERELIFNIIHPSITMKQEILTEDDRGKAIYITDSIDRDKEHLRIYKNGRLIPYSHYDIKYRENINSELGIDIRLDKKVGDVVVVDISPIKYREVLTIDTIPITGLIKTQGILTKPFSLKWYDVYLNGKKLNASNIDIISPTKFFIYNVDSRKNLVIMESNRDFEYFSIHENHRSYNDKLWDEYPGLSDQLIMQNGFIFESEEDILTTSVSGKSINMDRFYEYYAKHQPFLNPDEEFIPNEIWNQFDDLKDDNVIVLDPDINPNAPSILEFISDEEF